MRVDDFNERELKILRLIADGYSNAEIANALVITVNTVRWYNKQIYSKLGVHSRTLAVARARELGLMDGDAVQERDSLPEQRLHSVRSFDDVCIAYALAGQGPALVKTASYLSHLEFDWQSPIWRHWMAALSQDHTLVRYDERGTGLSDWDVDDLAFETWVRDLEAVVDAAGLEDFALMGLSQGGPVAIAYAAQHPQRVSRLILFGTYARGWLRRDLTEVQRMEERMLIDVMRVGWGRDDPAFARVHSTKLLPEATSEQLRALDELARISATPENAAALETEMHNIDVRHLAPQVQAPTLVLHSTDDRAVPYAEGRLLASLIPHAQFVPLESSNHILLEYEPAWEKFVSAIRAFLAG